MYHNQTLSGTRSHIEILWILNRILWDLRHNYEQSISFLDRPYQLVESAGLANFKALPVMFMITDRVARLGVPPVEQNHNLTDIMVGLDDGDRRIMWWWEASVDADVLMGLNGTGVHILRLEYATWGCRLSPAQYCEDFEFVGM